VATTDQWGRDLGVYLSVSEMAREMNSPTTNKVETPSAPSPSDKSWDELYVAVNSMATRADANASADLSQAERWANILVDFSKSFKKSTKNDKKEEQTNDFNSRYLEKIAEASESLKYGSQSQQPMWVGILKITGQAQKDIANAIRMSGCCGVSKEKLSKQNQVFSSRNKALGVSQASLSALGGKGGIMRDVIDSGNFGGRNNGGGNGGNNNGGMSVDNNGDDGGGGSGSGGIDPSIIASRWFALAGALQFVGGTIERIHRGLINSLNVDLMSNVFDGAIKNSNTFRESIRAVIHEQQGFGATNRAIEESYREIDAHVLASGVERGKYQEIYLNNLDRGLGLLSESEKRFVKGLKLDKQEATLIKMKTDKMQSVQTTALSTAKALHMSAGATNDMFMNWHMHLGMSETSLGEMGRHMQNVARSTGITGSQMESAMKSAEGVVKNLKRAGVASVDSVKHVSEFMAASQKHGFEGAADMMNAMASRAGLLESKSSMFLMNSARESGNPNQVNDLLMGRALSTPNGMKDQMKGQEAFTRKLFGNFQTQLSSVGVDATKIDAGNLSEVIQKLMGGDNQAVAAANSLQMMFKGLGMEIGEAEQAFRAMQDSSLTPMERIDKFSKDLETMGKQGLTQTDEYSRLQQKLVESQTNLSMDAFGRMNKFSEQIAANGGVISEELRQEMSKSLSGVFGSEQGADAWLKDLSKNTDLAISQVNDRAKASGVDLNDLLKKRGVSGTAELSKLLKAGDIKGTRVLQESLQELGREEKTSQDPVTEIRDTLYELNNRLGGWLDKLGFGVGGLTVKLVYWGGFIAGILIDMLAAFAVARGMNTLLTAAGFTGIGTIFSRIGSMLYKGISTGFLAMRSVLGRLAGLFSRFAPSIGKFLGKAFAPLAVIIGGAQGYMDAESYGRSKGEGVLLGALTGGVGTGSVISDMIGVEKGSTTDKAIGVGTSALWAAAIGAAIGTFILPGIGTGVGAAIGAVVGAGIEIVKILTEGTDILNKYLIEPLTWVAKYLFSPIVAAYEILAGALTGDMTRVLEGITGYFLRWPDLILKMIGRFGPVVLSAIAQIANFLMSSIVSVFVDLPKFLWNSITNGLTSLASNEWVGPIFAPILDLWNTVGGVLGAIFGPIGEALTGLGVWVDELTTSFTSWMGDLSKAMGGFSLISSSAKLLGSALSFIASAIGSVVKFVARVIGFVVKSILYPFKLLALGVGAVVNWIGGAIKTLSGLIYGEIDFGTWLYDNTIGALGNLGAWLYDNTIGALGNLGAWLYDNTIGNLGNFGDFGPWLYDSTIGNLAGFGTWMYNNVTTALFGFGKWLWDNTIGAMLGFGKWLWDNTIGVMLGFGKWLWDNTIGAMLGFGKWLWDNTIGAMLGFGKWIFDNTTGRLIDLGVWIFDNITNGLANLGTWIYENITNGVKNVQKATTGEDLLDKSRVALDKIDATNKGGIEASSKRIETSALEGSSKKIETIQAELDMAKVRYATSVKEVDYWKKQEKDNASWILPDSFDPGYRMASETRQSRETEKVAMGGRVASLEQQLKIEMEKEKTKAQPKIQIDSTKPPASVDASNSINKLKVETSTIKDPLNKLVEIEKEKAKFTVEMTRPTINSSNPLSKIKSEASTVPDPLNKFKEGTRSIVQDGVAVLHKGEMIIPSEVWNQIKATGSGPFGAGSDVIKEFSMQPTKNNAMVDSLKNNMSIMKKEQPTTVSMSLEGAFEGNQSTEAMSSGIESNIKSMPFDVSEAIGSFVGQTLALALKHLIILSTALTNISMYLKEKSSENPDEAKDSEKVVIESLKNSILSSSKNSSTTTSLEGAFSSGESRSAIESSMSLETSKLFATTSNPTIDSLSKSVNEINRQSTGELKPSNLGLFDSNQSNEAQDSYTSKMIKTDLNNVISSAISTNQSNSRNDSKSKNIVVEVSRALDYEKSASEIASETQANKISNSPREKNIVVEVSRALDYERSASEIANETQTNKFSNNIKEKNIVVEASRALDYERSASEIASETQANKFSDNIKEKNIVAEVSRALDYEKSASEIASEIQANKLSNNPREKNIVVEASRALDYERSASEIANETQASYFYDKNNSSSNVSTNLLDYREQIKGEVGTLGLSRTTLESVVGQEHYGSQPSGGSAIMPSMDSIAEYLVVSQARKLDQMVEHLGAIRDKLSSTSTGTQIIGSNGGDYLQPARSGVKNIARDLTRGNWDLTYGDYSPGAVTTDGRGGSA
jgi:hypothetical protein